MLCLQTGVVRCTFSPGRIFDFQSSSIFEKRFAHTTMFWQFGMPFTDTTIVKSLSGLTGHKLSRQHVLKL